MGPRTRSLVLGGVWALVLGLPGTAPAAAADSDRQPPRIEALQVVPLEGAVEVSFQVAAAFDDRIQSRLDSGLEVTFRHQVEVRRRRSFWFNRKLAEKKILTSAIRDNLDGRYTLRRIVNGGIVETRTTTEADEMRDFLTRVERLRLEIPDDLPRDARTEVRAKTLVDTRFFFIFPYSFDTDWVHRPLPTPPATASESHAR